MSSSYSKGSIAIHCGLMASWPADWVGFNSQKAELAKTVHFVCPGASYCSGSPSAQDVVLTLLDVCQTALFPCGLLHYCVAGSASNRIPGSAGRNQQAAQLESLVLSLSMASLNAQQIPQKVVPYIAFCTQFFANEPSLLGFLAQVWMG